MENLSQTMGLVVFLAAALERFQEYVLGRFLNGKAMLVASVVLGLALAIGLKLDGLGELGYKSANLWVSYILTGLVMSGGSNLVHAIFGAVKAKVS